MATRQEFANSLRWNTMTVVLQVVIQLIYLGILARLVSEETFALMKIVLGIMGFAELFAQMGVGPALIQRREITQQHINGAFFTAVILGVLFTLLFLAMAPVIAGYYERPQLEQITQVVCFSFIISALAVVPRSIMMREMRFRVMFFASMISIIGGNLVVGLYLAHLNWNEWAYVWALITQNVLMTISLWLFQRVRVTRKWNWPDTRQLVGYGLGASLFNALNYLATQLDTLLVPKMSSRIPGLDSAEQWRQAGLYSQSNNVMTQPITIMGKLSDGVLFSGMSRLQDNMEALKRTMLLSINLIACIVVPATVFISFFAEEILVVWFGPKYGDGAPILRIMFFVVIFRTLSKLGDSLLRAKAVVYKGSWYKVIYIALIAVGVSLAIPYGLVAVAGAMVAATFIHFVMSMYISKLILGLSFREMASAFMPSVKLGFMAFVLCTLFVFVNEKINLPNLVTLLIASVYVLGSIMLMIYNRPDQLGSKSINPLNFLPSKIKSHRLMKDMARKLDEIV